MYSCDRVYQLTLFVEGKLTNAESSEIRQHIIRCKECTHVLANVLELQDLEADGLLTKVTQYEADYALSSLEKLIDSQPQTPTSSPAHNQGNTSDMKSRLSDFLGGVATIAGFTTMQNLPASSTPAQGWASENGKNDSTSVRNSATPSSTSTEGDDLTDIYLEKETETMYGDTSTTPQNAPKVIGTSGVDGQSSLIQQNYEDTCAIRSQELILRDFGINISEDDLRVQAMQNGWYTPGGGTSPNHVGNLLELHGVEVNRYENANIFTLTSELAKGHRIIIGVDSGELWNKGIGEDLEDQEFLRADHALIVSGIDTSDPNNIKVILTDPGSGDIAKEYPIEQFIDAWQDSNFSMVSTADPAPLAFNPEMSNFDYGLGHLSEVGNLSYEDFQELSAPYLELQLSTSTIRDQAELLVKHVQNSEFPHEDYASTEDDIDGTEDNFSSGPDKIPDFEDSTDDFENDDYHPETDDNSIFQEDSLDNENGLYNEI